MYDLKSSSICKYRDEKVKPLPLSVLLFSVLAIMFMTSSLQSIILMPVFVMMNFREVKQALYHENPLAEISVLFEEFGKSDLCLLLQLFITGAMIALTLVLCFSLLKRKPASIALSRCGFARKYLLGLLFGALLFAAVFGVASINGSIKIIGISSPLNVGILILLFLGYVVQGASEEFLFRGFLMCDLVRQASPLSAILLSSLAFALAHATNVGSGFIPLMNVFLFGVLASLVLMRSGSLLAVSALHSAWNFVEGHVFGCRVSGLITESTLFVTESAPTLSLTNGGEFGPEGGVAVTVVMLVSIVIVLVFPSKNAKKEAA